MVNILIMILIFVIVVGIFNFNRRVKGLSSKEDIERLEKKVDQLCSMDVSELFENGLFDNNEESKSQITHYWKRFKRHREACGLWRQLLHQLKDKDKVEKTIEGCEKWWADNQLFLNEETKTAFNAVLDLACEFKNKHKCEPSNVHDWYDKISKAGESLSKFPPLI